MDACGLACPVVGKNVYFDLTRRKWKLKHRNVCVCVLNTAFL